MSGFLRPLKLVGVLAVAVFASAPAMAEDVPAAKAPAVGILSVSPKTLNFANLNLKKHSSKSKYILVLNKGRAPLQVTFGSETSPFAVACSCTQVTLPPHKAVGVLIAFQPTSDGRFNGTFEIDSNAGKGPQDIVVNLKGRATGTPPASSSSVSGTVTGNQKPVSNATVNLMAAGDDTTHSGSALLFSTKTDSQGHFSFLNVHCPSPGSQIFVTSAGGIPSGCMSQNNALGFMAVLGTCSDIHADEQLPVNETSTAASAAALAPFVSNTSTPQVGSATTNSNQLANAFASAQQTAAGPTIPPNVNSLSNQLNGCAQCGSSVLSCQSLLSCGAPGSTCSGSSTLSNTLQAAFAASGSAPSSADDFSGD